MFDNRKIKHLRKLPEGNNIVLIWVMLLTMAGRCNSGGMIFLTENIPYTPKMLADELDFEENTVILALQALEQLDMIVTDNGYFTIAGWEEYQNADRLAEIREYNRLAQQKSRAKKKLLADVNDKSMTSQRCQGTDIDKEEEKRKKEEAVDRVQKVAECIKAETQDKKLLRRGSFARIKSMLIYPPFTKQANGKCKFTYTDKCSGCGICQMVCPSRNIEMKDGRPEWKDNCTQCLACIHRCPNRAIEHGKITRKKGRYFHK